MEGKTKGSGIEKYLREGLLALLPQPQCHEGAGKTFIFTLEGRYPDPRGVPWLVEKLASYYSLNLLELRRRCGKLLGLRHHISLPLAESLVLLPVKMRLPAEQGETSTGFINLLQVQEILPPPPAPPQPPGGQAFPARVQSPGGQALQPPVNWANPGCSPAGQPSRSKPLPGRHPFQPLPKTPVWLSRVQFKCGLQLKTLNTPGTLRERLRQGEHVLQDFLRRRSFGVTFVGMSRKALLDQLPNCDCVLKDVFIDFFGLKAD